MKYFPSIHNRLHICYLIHSRQQSTKKATLYKASTHAFSDSHWACKVKDVIKPFVHKAKESHLLNTGNCLLNYEILHDLSFTENATPIHIWLGDTHVSKKILETDTTNMTKYGSVIVHPELCYINDVSEYSHISESDYEHNIDGTICLYQHIIKNPLSILFTIMQKTIYSVYPSQYHGGADYFLMFTKNDSRILHSTKNLQYEFHTYFLFNTHLLMEIPAEAFKGKSRKNTHYKLYHIHTDRRKLTALPNEHIPLFFTFYTCLWKMRTTRFIPTIEQLVPGFGERLITMGFTMMDSFEEISFDSYIPIFLEALKYSPDTQLWNTFSITDERGTPIL